MSGAAPAARRSSLLWAGLFLKLSARELQIAALFIFFPALMAIVYAAAYDPGSGSIGLRVIVASGGPGDGRASPLASALRSSSLAGESAVAVYESRDLDASMRALRDGSVDAVVDASGGTAAGRAEARIYVDPASGMGAYAESLVRAAAASASGPGGVEPAWRTTASFTEGSGGSNDFLLAVPGLFVFGWVLGAMTTALLAVREVRRRTIERAALALSSPAALAAGLWAAQAVLGLLQAAALAAFLPLCGFPAPARPLEAAAAILVLNAPMSALATACGLATAALCSSEGVAVNLCMVFVVPLAFLSGAAFPLASPVLFEVGGYAFAAVDFLPSASAAKALELALVRGSGLAAAAPAIAVSASISAIWAAGGAALFGRTRLSSMRRLAWVRH